MYPVTERYQTAITSMNKHHIRGVFTDAGGAETELTDERIYGDPRLDRQCVSDPNVWNFGEMYVGTLEMHLNMPGVSTAERFAGGKISLEFGVSLDDTDEDIEWLPLGVWDITAERESENIYLINGTDCINRLKVPVGKHEVGVINIESAMKTVTKITGVEFAQTPYEVIALIGGERGLWSIFGVEFAETCWDEVRMIAQLIGGFACADRRGRIEFRKFLHEPCMKISADMRHNARISDSRCFVHDVGYSDRYGNTYSVFVTNNEGTSISVTFSDNRYIAETRIDYQEQYGEWLRNIVRNVGELRWYAGTVDYYGDPALDLGDMVTIDGGLMGGDSANILICAESWQFRSPQTLISAGAAENGSVSSGGGTSGSTASAITQVYTTKAIQTVQLDKYQCELYEAEKSIAKGGFSVKSETNCFISAGAVFEAFGDSSGSMIVYVDEIAQDFRPRFKLREDEPYTAFFTLPLTASGGTHSVRITASGLAEVTDITACVWGQEITEGSPDMTSDEDYTYTVSGGLTTVTGYLGSSIYPEIPDGLGGGITTIIAKTAFTDSNIEAVYIPEGVTEIS